MHMTIFIAASHAQSYNSPFFELFSPDIRQKCTLSSSFKTYRRGIFPIFTNIDDYIDNFINQHSIKKYGLILDTQRFVLNQKSIQRLLEAAFVYFIGRKDNHLAMIAEKINGICYERICMNLEQVEKKYIVSEISSLEKVYEDILSHKIYSKKIYVFDTKNRDKYILYKNEFKKLNVELVLLHVTTDIFVHMLSRAKRVYHDDVLFESYVTYNENCIKTDEFLEVLQNNISKSVKLIEEVAVPKINIVCFRPTYLFADLVERFKSIGCVHSDFPRADADAYIWMRPQEIWHYEYVLRKRRDTEIKDSYIKSLESGTSAAPLEQIHMKSVAIHHGTCFEPLYQFCPEKLALALYNLPRVVGVCEFEECYGPAANIANPENFVFFPIGYDSTLFTEDHIGDARHKEQNLRIGIVGRAYGTLNKEQMAKSRLSEPYGYRKGADQILDIALRLKARNLPFELHFLGANWEPLVELAEEYHINTFYYTRDKNITYREFPHAYANFDVLLITSRCEGGPVSALEALSLGIPVVSTNVGICSFLQKTNGMENAVSCFDYDKKWNTYDTEKAIKAILDIYTHNINYEKKMEIRKSISTYTTESWVDFIYNEVKKII